MVMVTLTAKEGKVYGKFTHTVKYLKKLCHNSVLSTNTDECIFINMRDDQRGVMQKMYEFCWKKNHGNH